jgi:hypothetical protein
MIYVARAGGPAVPSVGRPFEESTDCIDIAYDVYRDGTGAQDQRAEV